MAPDESSDTGDESTLVTVVGIGADGWSGLGESARLAIIAAPLVIAGHRQQTLLPDIAGQDRRRWPTPMLPTLAALLREYQGRQIMVLVPHDPLGEGVGQAMIDRLGSAHVRLISAPVPGAAVLPDSGPGH